MYLPRCHMTSSLRDGLINHVYAIKTGLPLPIFNANQLIHLYAKQGRLLEARNLFDEMPNRNVFSWNAIISAYVKSQYLAQAKALFNSASIRDLVTYNSMLSGYVSLDGYESDAIELFVEMQSQRCGVGVDEFTVTTMLNLFAKLGVLGYGMQLHCYMVKTAKDGSGFAVSSLIDMYSKCGCFRDACTLFEGCEKRYVDLVSRNAMIAACCREGEMEKAMQLFWRDNEFNDTVTWNTLISGYVQNNREEEALKIFRLMWDSGVKWNEHTLASILSACAVLRNLKLGKEIHVWVLKSTMISNMFICGGIVDVYCKCGNMQYAEAMYLGSDRQNSFLVTSMIVGYSLQGNMEEARKLFDSLEERNAVAWTALITGYVRSQQCEAVLELLREFGAKEAAIPDALILLNVLRACALQAALSPGKQIHGYLYRMGIKNDEKMTSALVDMYAKCGAITYAEKNFHMIKNRDVVLYNVMIAGYAHHGQETEAVQLFHEMLDNGIRPDAVTFIALLSACRHCGWIELGEKFFCFMAETYNIQPENDHYTCMIDLYGRANRLEQAMAFMERIPAEQLDAVILGAFLHACRTNKNTEFARKTEEKLLKIAGESGDRYVQLANMYAAEGKWTEMGRVRKQMRGKEAKKVTGCSWVYVDNGVHIFTSGDRSHSKAEAIYSLLDCLTRQPYELAETFCEV